MSITRIEEARTVLRAQIENGPGRRSVALERMCQEYLEHLERSMAELNAISHRLDRKVELNSRYRDSLSTVLALRDSQNSIRQNRTIERLTLLTIGYLPLTLTAVSPAPTSLSSSCTHTVRPFPHTLRISNFAPG